MIVQTYHYKEGSTENAMVMQLLRGGFTEGEYTRSSFTTFIPPAAINSLIN